MTISVDKRPGSARHNATAPVAVGIDSLYVSAYVDGLKIDWMQLEYERENLSLSPGQEFSEIKLGNENFALHRGRAQTVHVPLIERGISSLAGATHSPMLSRTT